MSTLIVKAQCNSVGGQLRTSRRGGCNWWDGVQLPCVLPQLKLISFTGKQLVLFTR